MENRPIYSVDFFITDVEEKASKNHTLFLLSERGMSFEKTFRRQVWHGPRLRGKLGEQSNNFSLEKLKAGF